MNTACERKTKNKNYTRNNNGKRFLKLLNERLGQVYVACGLTFLKNELQNNSVSSVLYWGVSMNLCE